MFYVVHATIRNKNSLWLIALIAIISFDREEVVFRNEENVDEPEAGSSGLRKVVDVSSVYRPIIGEWVNVVYDEEIFTGVVTEEENDEWEIRCLICQSNGYYRLESENISVWFNEDEIIGKCERVPTLLNHYKGQYSL